MPEKSQKTNAVTATRPSIGVPLKKQRWRRLISVRAYEYILLCILCTIIGGCIALPVTENTGMYIQVAPPPSPTDIEMGKRITAKFACQYGYVVRLGLTQNSQAGEPLFKAFGYSGSLKNICDYQLDYSNKLKVSKTLPYTFGMAAGDNGRLFFDMQLQHVRDEHSLPVLEFLTEIKDCYGDERVRVVRPTWTDWIGMGD